MEKLESKKIISVNKRKITYFKSGVLFCHEQWNTSTTESTPNSEHWTETWSTLINDNKWLKSMQNNTKWLKLNIEQKEEWERIEKNKNLITELTNNFHTRFF